MTKKFDWNIPSKWLVVFIYMQIFGVNFKSGDDCFEPRFIYDPIQEMKNFDKKDFKSNTLIFGGVLWETFRCFGQLSMTFLVKPLISLKCWCFVVMKISNLTVKNKIWSETKLFKKNGK